MPREKDLNGIPGNIANSYFSSIVNQGNSASWICFIAEKTKTRNIKIDVLNRKILPQEVDYKQLYRGLDHLENIIFNQLKNFGFKKTFIQKATLEIEVDLQTKIIYCKPILIDENGKVYTSKKVLKFVGFPMQSFIFDKVFMLSSFKRKIIGFLK